MANKREYEIKVDAKIEPVAQFVKVVELANKGTENWGEKLKDVMKIQQEQSEQEKKNSQQRQKSFKLMDELHKSFETQYNSRVTNEAKMLSQSQKVADTISQINGLTEESYKLLTKNNQAKMASVQGEIDALAKSAKSVEAVTKAYEKKKQAIEEQSAIARSEAEAAYNAQIENAKQSGKDILSLETSKAEQIKRINDQLNKDLKKNAEEYTTSYNTIFKKLAGGLSDNMEVYMDTTSKKTKEKVQKVVKDTADLLGLEEEALKGVADGLLKTAAAEQKTAETAKTATETVKKAAETATAEVKKTGEEAAKTSESTKKIVDINATRENIKVMKQMLDSYRIDLKETGRATIKYYDDEIKAADNTEKRKELEAKKAEAVKFYGGQLVGVSQAIATAEKKQQDLGLLQWKQYAEKVQGAADSVKGITEQISGALGSAFTAVSNAYKAEIESIDEDIKQLQNKNKEFIQQNKNQQAELTAAKEETAAYERKVKSEIRKEDSSLDETQVSDEAKIRLENDETVKNLVNNERLKQEALDESLAQKQEIERKERELNDKKAKKQKEQEKIDKLNRKAALIKSIGEATASVAQGITKALAYGPFIGPVLAAVVGAAGAVQIGIMTKQLAKFQDGGLLRGKRHSQGGMRIEGTNMEVEGGEFVVNRVSTDKNLGLVKYINEQRRELSPSDLNTYFSRSLQGAEPSFRRMFADGGQLPAINNTVNVDNENLIKAIQSIRIEPKVAVTDIAKVQENMVSVDGWAGV